MVNMRGFSFRSLAFMFFIVFLVWSASFDTCIARRGKHWRQSRSNPASLAKKKGKSHRNSHHQHHTGVPKPKAPPHKAPALPPPVPKEKAPKPKAPPHKAPAFPPPAPKEKAPKPSPPQKGSTTLNPHPSPPAMSRELFAPHSTVLAAMSWLTWCYGATQAFQAAWAAACKVAASTMIVPAEYAFLVGPISFSGPYCQADIVFQLDGTIIAPSNANAWGRGLFQWLEFTKLVGITIQGKGTIDGSGSVWWQDYPFEDPIDSESELIIPLNNTVQQRPPMPIRNELNGKMPSMKPTALRFYGSFNVTVTGITIQNSPQCHLKFDNCVGVAVHDMRVSSPGDSPNTDGIHLQNSKDVLIHSTDLACGDDCVSIQTGCTNVYIHNVNCGPGHGISIGGLGKDNTKACVSNITVRDIVMHGTMTGVRVKTWQGGSGSVQGVLFSNIQVSEVQLPIVIDQFYCDKSKCKNQTSAVALSGITYENIRGTYTVKPVHFACSDALPCMDVSLTTIQLKPLQEQYHLYDPFCWQTFGELNTPTMPPISCLQIGKPSGNHPQRDYDAC